MDDIQIYPGKYTKIDTDNDTINLKEVYHTQKQSTKKVIVLDLDETIGSFNDLYRLWCIIDDYLKLSINKTIIDFISFYSLLDLYPEFLRHGILHILDFIYHKKQQGICSNIYLYTNNQIITNSEVSSPTKWVSNIVDYLSTKICGSETEKIFDKLICAFKINRKIIEIKRTTNSKTYSDFIKCTVLPKRTEICFIDDTYYSGMATERVYYIQLKPYIHYIDGNTIIKRFIDSTLLQNIPFHLQNGLTYELYDCFGNTGNKITTKCEIEMDITISRKLMQYIREFFYLTTKRPKTRRIRQSPKQGTRRKISF
jgi:hypothetical protein